MQRRLFQRAANQRFHGILNLRGRPEDAETIAELFTETVHSVNARDYSQSQLLAWAPRPPDRARWRGRLGGEAIVLVAERSEQIVGFAAFTRDGHLDLLYVVESEARSHGATRLFAEVSITARPFFHRAGFRLIAEQTVALPCDVFVNYRMEKQL